MIDRDLKEVCKKLKPVIGRKADALWTMYATASTPRAKQEVEALIQTVASKSLGKSVDDDAILLPPPGEEAARGEFLLGTVLYGRKNLFPLFLKRENFIKHIGIYSITGGGKTNVCQQMLLGLLEKEIPFLVIDWKRSYRSLLTLDNPKAKRIKVFSVGRKSGSSFSWNPLRGPPNVHPKTWMSLVVEVLEKSHISGPGVADIFIELFDKKFDEFGFYDKPQTKFPNFFDASEELRRTQYKGRRMLWQDSCGRILKTFTFGPASGAFNARHPVHIEDLLDGPVILELDQELPKPLRVFFSEIILRWIHLFRLNQGETDDLQHVTVLEEVHNLFPKTQIEKQATSSVENLFREIRGFGEGLITITQHPSLLPIYVLGNSNTQLYLSLQHEDDIQTAKRALFLENSDLGVLNSLQVGEGIVKIKGRIGPCYVRFPYVPVAKGAVSDDMINSGGLEDRKTKMD